MGLTLDIPLYIDGGVGIDLYRDLFTLATTHNIITVAGGGWTTFEYNGKVLKEQGSDNFIKLMRDDNDLYTLVRDRVYNEVINISAIIGESNTIGEEIKTSFDIEDARNGESSNVQTSE
jgi:hypothetical protein